MSRIAELKRRASEKTTDTVAISKAWAIEKLRENAEQGMAEGQRTPAIRALELIGKELGMFVDRKQISVEDLRKLPTEELVRLLTYIDGEIQTAVH